MATKVAWALGILFMNDVVVSASRSTVSFDLFAVHKICRILSKNDISVASCLFCNCFRFFTTLHPNVIMGSI